MPDYKDRQPLSYYSTALPGVDYSELQGKLIVIEGPDAVGRSTQIRGLKPWLEEAGHAVLDTGMARSALAGKGIEVTHEWEGWKTPERLRFNDEIGVYRE